MIRVILTGALLVGGTALAQSTNPAPYCDASFDDMQGFPVADAVTNVSFGTISNNSGGQYAAPHYVFYSNLPTASFQKGNSYPLSVTFDVHGGCGYGVWIDYNHNNAFEANEKVAGNTANNMLDLSDATVVNATVTIPDNAMTGATRMRVRIVEDDMFNMANGWVPVPCNASNSSEDVMDWGETEDYAITITGSSAGLSEMAELVELSVQDESLSIKGTTVQGLSLYSMSGELVRSSTTETLNLSGVRNGIFLLKVLTINGQLLDFKIVR